MGEDLCYLVSGMLAAQGLLGWKANDCMLATVIFTHSLLKPYFRGFSEQMWFWLTSESSERSATRPGKGGASMAAGASPPERGWSARTACPGKSQ